MKMLRKDKVIFLNSPIQLLFFENFSLTNLVRDVIVPSGGSNRKSVVHVREYVYHHMQQFELGRVGKQLSETYSLI